MYITVIIHTQPYTHPVFLKTDCLWVNIVEKEFTKYSFHMKNIHLSPAIFLIICGSVNANFNHNSISTDAKFKVKTYCAHMTENKYATSSKVSV